MSLVTKCTKKGYAIPLEMLNNEDIKRIQKDLTFVATMHGLNVPFPMKPPKVISYRESENYLWVPRYYGLSKFGKPKKEIYTKGVEIDIQFNGNLRPKQQEIADLTIKHLKESGGGILSLYPGFGKTITALYLIHKLQRKSLWIVHKTFLMDQVKSSIEKFLPGTRVGLIRQDKIEIDNCDIVIAMLQSISMKEYPKDTFKDFGCVVVDEAHHIAAQVFSQSLWKVTSEYMIGLSATPDRKDGLSNVFYQCLGPVIYSLKNTTRKPIIRCIDFYEMELQDIPSFRNGKPCTPKMINMVCENWNRNKIILENIGNLLEEKRKIIVISDRREHLSTLYNFCTQWYPKYTFGFYVGQMKREELKKSEDCDVIFGTYSMSSEGLDIPSLNTLILASPKSDVEQTVGRILRKDHEGIEPLVIDIVDHWGSFENQANRRLRWYRKMDFDIEGKKKKNKNTLKEKDTTKIPKGFKSFLVEESDDE